MNWTFPSRGRPVSRGWNRPTWCGATPALRDGYLQAMGGYLEEVRRGCTGNNIDYVLLRTSQPLDAALAAFLSNRLRMHQQECPIRSPHRNLKQMQNSSSR